MSGFLPFDPDEQKKRGQCNHGRKQKEVHPTDAFGEHSA
jgi:hypothetical protein